MSGLSSIDEIKERLSIVDVVSSYLKLEKAGVNFKARCPFHNEKTPSFFVSPSKGIYHCFGCGKGGDIFSFVESIEGISFSEALRILAEKAGVVLKDDFLSNENKILYEILDESSKFFENYLWQKQKEALKYLKERGLTEETIKKWRLGFAPYEEKIYFNFLKEKNYKNQNVERCGLILITDNGPKVRFRNRIMFPLFNNQGKIIGFSGRIFGEESNLAKYINSPQTVLFNKSKIMYGFYQARESIMKEKAVIVVEGQMDVLMAHQTGTTNVIGVSGTALTEEQLNILKRFTDNLILSFDNDQAGENAALRSWQLALSSGFNVKILSLPSGKDPAEIILKNIEEWKNALKNVKHIVDFVLDSILSKKNISKYDSLKEVSKRVIPLIAYLSDNLEKDFYIRKISELFNISYESVREEVKKFEEKEISEAQLQQKKEIESIQNSLFEELKRQALEFFVWQGNSKNIPIEDLKVFIERFEKLTDLKLENLLNQMSDIEKAEESFKAEAYWGNARNLFDVIDNILDNLEINILKNYLNEQFLLLNQKKGSPEELEILKKCQEITLKINDLKNKNYQK